jgi:hypothetical protein
MNYLGQDEFMQVMGIGYPDEVRQGPDGNLYQWVEGVDGLGNPIGGWRRVGRALRRVARGVRRGVRRAAGVAQQVASAIPHPKAQAAAAALRAVRRSGVAGNGLGALYQAPDGTLYQLQGLGDDELIQVMGIGYPDEVRQGPDGNLYQWVEGVDGLGNPIGAWRRVGRALRRVARGIRRGVRRAAGIAQRVASAIPLPQAQAAAAALRAVRGTGVNGLGALYQAPDGTLYQLQGLAEDEELYGFGEDEELEELGEDEELYGLGEDEEPEELGEDEELYGLAEDEELEDLGEDEELEGYIRENGVGNLEAYVPAEPPQTRMFTRPTQPPEIWKPLW